MTQQAFVPPFLLAASVMNRQFAESVFPMAKVMESVNRHLAASIFPTAKVMESVNRHLAASIFPTAKVIESVNRQLAASVLPTAKVIESVNRQLAASVLPTAKVIESMNRHLTEVYSLSRIRTHALWDIQVEHSFNGYLSIENPESLYKEGQWLYLFDQMITHPGLRQVSRKLFSDGYYALAVERAYVYLNNMVQARAGLTTKDGADLMRAAFSANSPVLKLNAFQTESEKAEQRGYMDLFAGSMTGIRNLSHMNMNWLMILQLLWNNLCGRITSCANLRAPPRTRRSRRILVP